MSEGVLLKVKDRTSYESVTWEATPHRGGEYNFLSNF